MSFDLLMRYATIYSCNRYLFVIHSGYSGLNRLEQYSVCHWVNSRLWSDYSFRQPHVIDRPNVDKASIVRVSSYILVLNFLLLIFCLDDFVSYFLRDLFRPLSFGLFAKGHLMDKLLLVFNGS